MDKSAAASQKKAQERLDEGVSYSWAHVSAEREGLLYASTLYTVIALEGIKSVSSQCSLP